MEVGRELGRARAGPLAVRDGGSGNKGEALGAGICTQIPCCSHVCRGPPQTIN